MSKSVSSAAREAIAGHHTHLLCWRSVLGGLLISFMGLTMLMALGAGIGGFTMESLISSNTSANGTSLASAAGLWVGLSMVASLFCGSYFALRVSGFTTARIGAAHGFLIASLFFGVMLSAAGSLIGGASSGAAKLVQKASGGAGEIADSPMVQDVINHAVGGAQLKSDAKEVAHNISTRLMSGDVDSAKEYLAQQAGMSSSEADAKIVKLNEDFQVAMKKAGEKASRAVGDAGITLFVIFLVGLIGAVFGGRTGAIANENRPLAALALGNERGSMLPYALGWLAGVPVSILLLIALLRSVF